MPPEANPLLFIWKVPLMVVVPVVVRLAATIKVPPALTVILFKVCVTDINKVPPLLTVMEDAVILLWHCLIAMCQHL